MNSRSPGCSDNCTFSRLYAGSQASLSDMAARQAEALSRVSRLRAGVVGNLKKNYPTAFSDAESQLGRRMSQVDDEILLAYLDGFLAMPPPVTNQALWGQSEDAGSKALRGALSDIGVTLPAGTDHSEWAAAIKTWSQSAPVPGTPAVSVTPSDDPRVAPDVHVSSARVAHEVTTSPAVTDLFAPAEPTHDPHPFEPHEDVPFEHEPAEDPYLEQGPPMDDPGWGDSPWESLFDGAEDLAYVPQSDAAEVVEDALSWPAPDADLLVEADVPASTPSDLRDVFAEEPAAEVAAEPAPVDAPAKATAPDHIEQTSPSTPSTSETPPPAPTSRRPAAAVKPELFPTAKAPARAKAPAKGRKVPRVVASAPSALDAGDVTSAAAAAGGVLTQELQNQLTAAVCVPRPVFTSDLVNLVGDADLVRQWEERNRVLGTSGSLRFVVAKARHRGRGNLVFPYAQALRRPMLEHSTAPWVQCLEASSLRGAKLYEVAVLLHRFGDKIVTIDITPQVITLRINDSRGLVGVVVALGGDMGAGEDDRLAVAAAVEDLNASRLALLAVVTVIGTTNSLSHLTTALQEEAETRDWKLSAPLIASKSWDFADDGGTSAVAVI